MITKKAFITGITGQDGSYLAEFLLSKGYEVHGLIRRASTFNTERIDHLYQDPHLHGAKLFLHYGDLTDGGNLMSLISNIKPDEVYNLGAQSHVRVSFDVPEHTVNSDADGALRVLEAIRQSGVKTKFYQASSSEMFGLVQENPQKETTPFYPRSPYACAKVFSHWLTINYRESYNMFACSGILFNHESPRRGETFVTRKITRAIARIQLGLDDKLFLGNLDAKRDWGFAGDYVEMMWLMLQQDKPDDYVIATGETHSVREFLMETFAVAGIEVETNGKNGSEEKFINKKTGKVIVEIDPRYYRPTEVDVLLGDPSKAKNILGWEPKIKFKELVRMMYESDLKREKNREKNYERYFRASGISRHSKVYIAGHNGLVGSAIVRRLRNDGYTNLVFRTHAELDLSNQSDVASFFQREKPEYVFLAAAKVGGIMANNNYPSDFIYENLQIQNNIIHQSYLNGVKKLLFLGSSCIYPKLAPQPMKESYLLSGYLEPTNEPYAIAKIAGIKMCQSYNRQYGTNFIAVMPTNLYGPGDNFDLNNSHVMPALIRKFHEAKIRGDREVGAWGTGSPRREFLHVDDMADGCLFLMNNFNPTREQNENGEVFVNLGTGEDVTIKELTELVKEVVGFEGEIVWDTTKPDGAPRKLLDMSNLHSLGWRHKTELKEGVKNTYEWYLRNK